MAAIEKPLNDHAIIPVIPFHNNEIIVVIIVEKIMKIFYILKKNLIEVWSVYLVVVFHLLASISLLVEMKVYRYLIELEVIAGL